MRRNLPFFLLLLVGLLLQNYVFAFFSWLGPKWAYFLSWLVG